MITLLLAGIFAMLCAVAALLAVLVRRGGAAEGGQTDKELLADKAFSEGVNNVLSYMGKGRDD